MGEKPTGKTRKNVFCKTGKNSTVKIQDNVFCGKKKYRYTEIQQILTLIPLTFV